MAFYQRKTPQDESSERDREQPGWDKRWGFHAHLDVCAWCARNPFALCDVGAAALRAEVGGVR